MIGTSAKEWSCPQRGAVCAAGLEEWGCSRLLEPRTLQREPQVPGMELLGLAFALLGLSLAFV